MEVEMIQSDEIGSLPDLLQWIRENEREIYVRVNLGNGFENLTLVSVPPRQWAECIAGWIERQQVPIAVRLEDDES
jgi:hypothetical protein